MPRLIHGDDTTPGLTRVTRGKGFIYLDAHGRRVTSETDLARIRSLAIPPAWTKVWIAPRANAHLQATGRDQRGRKQYRYHPRWMAMQDETKYSRMLEFGEALPALRQRIEQDLDRRGLPRQKVLAAVVQLLERTLIRVGNGEYVQQNGSYGLTTILDRHAHVTSGRVRFRFRGKSRKQHDVVLSDARLARIVRNCRELPGSQLFQYVSERGTTRNVTSADVNRYLRAAMGQDFTAKDFRTWSGTVLAAHTLGAPDEDTSPAAREREIVRAVDVVAQSLGNTRSVCRKCYIHPVVIEAYLDGRWQGDAGTRGPRTRQGITGHTRIERAVLRLLRDAARRQTRMARAA